MAIMAKLVGFRKYMTGCWKDVINTGASGGDVYNLIILSLSFLSLSFYGGEYEQKLSKLR
jgi:hypothetical protein